MKVLEARTAFLSNYEVAVHLEQLTNQQDAMLKKGSYSSALEAENLRTIQFELKAYLDKQPCQSVTPESLRALLLRLKDGSWGLTKTEKLMILNQVPGNEAEMSVLLEEYADRFSEDERSELLEAVEATLGRRETPDNQGAQINDDGADTDMQD